MILFQALPVFSGFPASPGPCIPTGSADPNELTIFIGTKQQTLEGTGFVRLCPASNYKFLSLSGRKFQPVAAPVALGVGPIFLFGNYPFEVLLQRLSVQFVTIIKTLPGYSEHVAPLKAGMFWNVKVA